MTTSSTATPVSAATDAECAGHAAALDVLLAERSVRSVYQPIVELDSGTVVAYEALARGPAGSALERPDLMFAAARRAGRVSELDAACRQAALQGARSAGLRPPWSLFVNIEPEAAKVAFLLDGPGLEVTPARAGAHAVDAAEAAEAMSSPEDALQVVVELTERALIADPTELLRLVARIRSRGWGVALDDVGADRNSLALLPLLRPDVIKLDLRLVQQRANAEIAQIVSAVNAEAERSGTVVLAEGIETEEHLRIALSLGATLGQGWLLGRPAAIPTPLPAFTGEPIAVVERGEVVSADSPFAMGAALRQPRPARKHLLIEVSKHLERQAIQAGESAVVVATFQDQSFFTPATSIRYARLAAGAAFVGAIGEGMPASPLPDVRGCVLDHADPLVGEWDIVVVGPHFTATLVARDLGDTGPDSERRFEFVLSHDRELAIKVALALMSRVWPTAG